MSNYAQETPIQSQDLKMDQYSQVDSQSSKSIDSSGTKLWLAASERTNVDAFERPIDEPSPVKNAEHGFLDLRPIAELGDRSTKRSLALDKNIEPAQPASNAEPGPLLSGKLPDPLPKPLDAIGKSREELEAIRASINHSGKDPAAALVDLVKHNRVLAMGELHAVNNPQRDFGAAMMKQLQEAGATHLAAEIDKSQQPLLNTLMETGKIDVSQLPNMLQTDGYVNLLKSACAAGLKLVAVDQHLDGWSDRDKRMAANVSSVLEENPANKVIFWVGALHLNRNSDPKMNGADKTAGARLAEHYNVATVLDQGPQHGTAALSVLTHDIARAALVSNKENDELGSLQTSSIITSTIEYYRDWDYTIIYPWS